MSNITGKNILVTGGTGLVGSHLVEKLISLKPGKIVCLVRALDPDSYFFSQKLGDKAVLAFGDLKDKERIFDIISKYEINHIFHLGAQAIVNTAYVNPYETFATNIMGTVNILEAARLAKNIDSVIVASTDKAYGKECIDVVETQPMAGDHPYDVSKSATDLIARTYFKTYGLPIAVSRFGNIYGPGDLNYNRLIPGIIKTLLTGEKLDIRSDGKFRRDFVYVKDVVEGYLRLAENIDKIKGEAFNFSSKDNFSVLEVIEKVEKTLGQKVNYEILNNQKNEIPNQSLNFDKARENLSWNCQSDFEENIKETFNWYKDNLK